MKFRELISLDFCFCDLVKSQVSKKKVR